ncbi:hypothetical protein AB0N81_10550 [Streptomyces sp. NPDC093510]
MLLGRIDHEEPYYANVTANLLRNAGMTWLDRDEIRLVSAEAQKIHV